MKSSVTASILPTRALALVLSLAPLAALDAQRGLKNIPDPNPELERRSFEVAEGFDVNLFASEPMVRNPIHMNWDSEGRLWVATSPIYPHIEPGAEANDQIVVLEDVDGDGVADRHTVFADDLLIPTAVVPGDGGAYVANSTELLHMVDTDGDGRADRTRVVLSGFGTEDTHHILHTILFGPDGRLYFNQSIYIHSHVETPHGVRRLGGGGAWRFRPETMALDVFIRGFVNSWGHRFDRWGQSFFTDGAYGEGINYAFPGAVFVTAVGAKRILRGLNPGQPKECGLEVLSGRHLPEDWSGSLVTNDFRANRVVRFALTEDGSGFASRQVEDLVRTKHVAFRPIDVKMGPDGAIYVADWYNPIIQHGEVSFRDDRRDHVHGRIWRFTKKGRPLAPRPHIVGAEIAHLLELLKAPEDWTRLHAKLELKGRGADAVTPALGEWVETLARSDPAFEHHRLEALWTFQALDSVHDPLLRAVLASRDHRARAAAVRVLAEWQPRFPDAHELLMSAVLDGHPRVRLEAVNALRANGSARAAEIAMRALDQPVDEFLDFALWLTARDLQPVWLPAFERGEITFGGNLDHVAFALRSTGNSAVLRPLIAMLRGGKITADKRDDVLAFVADVGGAEELQLAFDFARDTRVGSALERARLLDRLVAASERRGVVASGAGPGVLELLRSDDARLARAGTRAAAAWKIADAVPHLVALARGPSSVRADAIDALGSFEDTGARDALRAFSTSADSFSLRSRAAAALARVDRSAGIAHAVQLLGSASAEEDPALLLNAILRLKDGAEQLAAAIAGTRIDPAVAQAAINAAESTGRELGELVSALRASAGLTPVASLGAEKLERLATEILTKGNPARGESIYRRTSLACTTCHAIAGAGGKVGPDLISIGASAPVDYLIDSLLEPNKKIKEGYHLVEIVTKDFEIYSGTLVGKDKDRIVLREASGDEVELATANVEEENVVNRSMMPAGLVANLSRAELVDLVRFLAALGKDVTVSNEPLVRRWRSLAAASANAPPAAIVDAGSAVEWKPVYSRVDGSLPLSELEAASDGRRWVFFEVEVTTPGRIRFEIEGLSPDRRASTELWFGGSRVAGDSRHIVNAPSGVHRVTLAIDARSGGEGVTVALVGVPGSAANARVLGGN